ncbi:hypothetical protein THRCLA_22317, partial [Thraustotheca clavata]
MKTLLLTAVLALAHAEEYDMCKGETLAAYNKCVAFASPGGNIGAYEVLTSNVGILSICYGDWTACTDIQAITQTDTGYCYVPYGNTSIIMLKNVFRPCPNPLPPRVLDKQFCTANKLILSEFYGNLFTDAVRSNNNEKFQYNQTAQTIAVKSNNQCLEVYPNPEPNYGFGSVKTAPCDFNKPSQKWVLDNGRLSNSNYKYCLETNPFKRGSPVTVVPCGNGNPLYSNKFFTECSSITRDFVRIVSSRGKRISEFFSGLYFDTPRDNFNELFWWNSTTQMFKSPMGGECLDAFRDSDGKYKLHTYGCNEENPNQKWIVHADTKKIEHATHRGQCLDGDPTYADHHVQMWGCVPNNINQIWSVEPYSVHGDDYIMCKGNTLDAFNKCSAFASPNGNAAAINAISSTVGQLSICYGDWTACNDIQTITPTDAGDCYITVKEGQIMHVRNIFQPCPNPMPPRVVEKQICTATGLILSEYYGDLFTDVVRNNKNEKFEYNQTAQTLVAKTNGQCLEVFRSPTPDPTYDFGSVKTAPCDYTKDTQKWVLENGRLSNSNKKYCLETINPFWHGTSVLAVPCRIRQTYYSNTFFAECSTIRKDFVRIVSSRGKRISEFYSGLYFGDVVDNFNELFWWNPTTQMFENPMRGECLDSFLDADGKYKLHMYGCNQDNPNQKWIVHADTKKIEHATHRGQCLDGDPTYQDQHVQMWECIPNNINQMWTVEPFTASVGSWCILFWDSCIIINHYGMNKTIYTALQTVNPNCFNSIISNIELPYSQIYFKFYGSLITDVVRNNTNEHFTYNETSKNIVAKTNGLLLYWNVSLVTSIDGKFCFKSELLLHSYRLGAYPCDIIPSNQGIMDCSKVNADFVFIVSSLDNRVSEYYGSVYIDVPRRNFNELFTWNSTTQMFKSPIRGDCLDAYLDADGKYKLHMYTCSEDNPNQKWIIHENTKKIEHATHRGQCLDDDPTYEDHHLQMWECLPDNINQITLFALVLALAQAADIQICTGSGLILSEYYGDLFTDVIQHNLNEQFTYNQTTQTIAAKTNGQCLQLYPVGDMGVKYYFGSIKTAPCDAENSLQKWIIGENRITSLDKNYCFNTRQFEHSYRLEAYPCFIREDPIYSDAFFTDCSKLNTDFVHIVSSRGKRVSEHKGDVYFNDPRYNFNELFWWNSTTQMFKSPMRGDCLDAYLDADGKYKLHMYACSEDNVNQKWIIHQDTKKIEHGTHRGQCLDGDPTYADHHLQMWECLPDNINQIWTVE